MLRLKRASAGSGKTYELAKTYIKLLLTTRLGKKHPVLRKENHLQEALGSILAVTFTVKATAEMKQRIVDRLSDLSRADEISDDQIGSIEYLEEFMEDLNLPRMEVARLSRAALRTLLLHYSDFKVQTIDSFFQSILHTFAYEASLDENFNMEIDTDFITTVGFDTLLDEFAGEADSDETKHKNLHWLNTIMKERLGSRNWNVFARKEGNTLYSQIVKEAKNLEKEEYQNKREELYEYFSTNGERFLEIIDEVDEANFSPWKKLHEARRQAALELEEELAKLGMSGGDLLQALRKIFEESVEPFDKENFRSPAKEASRGARDNFWSGEGGKKYKTLKKTLPINGVEIEKSLDIAVDRWIETHNNYLHEFTEGERTFETWRIYKSMLPKLMVVLDIAIKKDEYLKTINSLQISDTAHILSRIISGSDVSFVYERMGSKLNHYLIDEFQDTSRMQWDNLYPLLSESDANGHDNLIIGDAKQSIYRFRNADSSLINEIVDPGVFPEVLDYTTEHEPADRRKMNTNFRSKPQIVEFNNHVFSNIVSLTYVGSDGTERAVFSPEVKATYRDCVQALPERKGKKSSLADVAEGYVEIIVTPALTEKQKKEFDTVGMENEGERGFQELPERILELRSRGYSFSDIAILVISHDQGHASMNVINRHNSLHPDKAIPVISEENMLVASALSVKLLIHALEMILKGKDKNQKRVDILPEPIDEKELFDLLGAMPSMALPSIVEAVTEKFVPKNRRDTEAPFLAAFQDAVVDYCSNRPGDIGSFLKWWKQKSKTLSITSPEDSEGVKLLTIHKSKGLEYKCVIIPVGDFSFDPGGKTEWKWVVPDSRVYKAELLPPYLPIETKEYKKKGATKSAPREVLPTWHLDVRDSYCRAYALDELNKMYVAFTRAANELYVYTTVGAKSDERKASCALKTICADHITEDSTEDRTEIVYGEKATPCQIAQEKEKEAAKKANRKLERISGYGINGGRKLLHVADGNRLLRSAVHTGDDDELDPRAEGTLKHRLMQMLETPEDLDKALKEMKVTGLISSRQVSEWGEQIRKALNNEQARSWFDPSLKVYNERPILIRDSEHSRPDRVVVTPEGKAIVIDYKFGEPEKKYRRQLERYASILRQTGEFTSVEAYIWYVADSKIEAV